MVRTSRAAKERVKSAAMARECLQRKRNAEMDDNNENYPPKKVSLSSTGTPTGIKCSIPERSVTNQSTLTDPVPQQIKVIIMEQSKPMMENKDVQVTPIMRKKLRTPTTCTNLPFGRRIVSAGGMITAIQDMSFHSSMCGKGPVRFSEERKAGLNLTTIFSCGCGKKFRIGADGNEHSLPVNEALVWGNTQAAIGFTASNSLFTTLEIPTPSYTLYKKTQDAAHIEITEAMNENMKYWATKETELAMEAGDYVMINNVQYPAIMVVLDGGWSKRSYRHSFSANCGVAVIIGVKTGKVIFASTKISTCLVCDSKTKTEKSKAHICYKNYTGSPNGMERELLLEGFQRSIQDHGLVYWKFVGDGDSSVYNSVINVYPGLQVKKIECCNHVCRNFTTRLLDISLNQVRGKNAPKIPLEERRLFNPTIPRFRTGLKQAIAHHHETGSEWKELYEDIVNMPMHIFGEHANCKQYFCKGPKENERNLVPHVKQMEFWGALKTAIDRPASLAPSLILKETSNYAESFMGVCCKFLEGKRKNFGQSYLYRLRVAAAVFSFNESSFWAGKAIEVIKKKDPNPLWVKQTELSMKVKNRKRGYQLRKPLKIKQLAPPNLDYGDNPARPGLPEDVLQLRIQEKKSSLQVSIEESKEIEQRTREQANSEEWLDKRVGRITASTAGPIFRLRDSTDNSNTLNNYFGRKIFSKVQVAMNYGREHESTAISSYESRMQQSPGFVKKAGFVIYPENGIFGASPDGFVGDDGLLEVKCPYSLHLKDTNKQGPAVWPNVSKYSSLRKSKDGKLELKKSHDHYFQVIMQLYVTGRQWCDYYVWSEHGDFLQRIERNEETDKLWEKMKCKLERFWENDLAPELVDSCHDRGCESYRCRTYRLEEKERKLREKERKFKKKEDKLNQKVKK